MLNHLREDWPWIVVPMVIVAIVATIIVIVWGPEPEPLFTYAM